MSKIKSILEYSTIKLPAFNFLTYLQADCPVFLEECKKNPN